MHTPEMKKDTLLNAKANQTTTSTKTEVDTIFNTNKAYTYTTVLAFEDVSNLGINTLSIIGSVNINIKNNTNVSLMDFSEFIVEVHPPFKTYSTITSIGNASFPNIYNKTEVDAYLTNNFIIFSHVITRILR